MSEPAKNQTKSFCFRLTFHHASPGLFRFEQESIPLELGEGLDLVLECVTRTAWRKRTSSTSKDAASHLKTLHDPRANA